MTTCILVALAIMCTDVRPATPAEAPRMLTAGVPPFIAPPLFVPRVQALPATYDQNWPFGGPIDHRPLSPPQWTSVTTYVPRFGPSDTV